MRKQKPMECSFLSCHEPAMYMMRLGRNVTALAVCKRHVRLREYGKWRAGDPNAGRPAPGEYTPINPQIMKETPQ